MTRGRAPHQLNTYMYGLRQGHHTTTQYQHMDRSVLSEAEALHRIIGGHIFMVRDMGTTHDQ